jgi:integrase
MSSMNHYTHVMIMRQHAPECYKPTKLWSRANLHCYAEYREWLKQTHSGQTTVWRYTSAARWVFCLVDKPYWQIDLDVDLAQVQAFIQTHVPSAHTRNIYRLGLVRFAEFLRLKCQIAPPPRVVHWDTFIGCLPSPMAEDVRAFIAQRQAHWSPVACHERTLDTLATLTRPLRHMAQAGWLTGWHDLTPKCWWRYTEMRLSKGIATCTLNAEMHLLHACLRFVADSGRPDGALSVSVSVSEPFLRLEPFKPAQRIPKDASLDAVRRLLHATRAQSLRQPINQGRLGLLDTAWLLLMLHGGLRTAEVRHLKLGDIDWQRRFIRIEQSKGLKDRMVPLSDAVIVALRAYLAVRGPADALPGEVFVFQHKPLSRGFCRARLRFYERATGVHLTPHQLRHTCATLLLNAGAPVTTVKLILGHVHIDTTLGYARVYDGTLAADYIRAMLSVERMLTLDLNLTPQLAAQSPAHVVALLDALKSTGTLNAQQLDVLATARAAVVGLANA